MVLEVNRKAILDVLLSEKGTGANVMIEEMKIEEPKEFHYGRQHIEYMFKDLDCDFFGRYNFQDMQNVILEDRRIRLNAWAAKILDKPVQKIKRNRHVNAGLSKSCLSDPRNLNYFDSRLQPLTMGAKKKDIKHTKMNFQASIIDKKKYYKIEEVIVKDKLLNRHGHKLVTVDNLMESAKIGDTPI